MSYYKQHPRKKEARDWYEQGWPGGFRGYCNRYGIYPLPRLAIPEWADPNWMRHFPNLSIQELDDHLKDAETSRDANYSLVVRLMDDLRLLDPFWRGQVRGHASGSRKRRWHQEIESYNALLRSEEAWAR
jgi:hypothetical protein